MKKGSFFTLGITFFGLIVFSMAIIASTHLAGYDQRFLEAVTLHRLYETDTSIQEGVKRIFETQAGLDISISQNSSSFGQSLPLYNDEFLSSLNSFENFVETNDFYAVLNFTETNEGLPVIIKPWNIIYEQAYSDNSIKISNTLPVSAYSFTLSFTQNNVTSCSSSLGAGAVPLSVLVTGTNGTSCSVSQNIDPTLSNTIQINTASINIGSGKINLSTSENLTSLIRLSFPDAGLEKTSAWIASNTTNVTFNTIRRIGGIRLA
ncbi:MAG: hypothetical protein ABIB71_00165 [Candidatus Woesearchaeota archaeon]